MYFIHDLCGESKCIFIPVGKFLSVYYSTIGIGKLVEFLLACTRKSHWGCPSKASEKRREQGVSHAWVTILDYCVFKNLPTGINIHLCKETFKTGF